MMLWGVLLCDLNSDESLHDLLSRHPRFRRTIQTLLIIAGLWAGSYPEFAAERSPWSHRLDNLNPYLFPSDSDTPKRWSSIAWHLISVGFWLSPTLKSVFSNNVFTWLGRNSFAVYLTHGTLLRVLFVKFVYGIGDLRVKAENGEEVAQWVERSRSWGVWIVAVPVWFGVVYVVAHGWTTYVDGWCARVTKSLEEVMFKGEDQGEKRSGAMLV